MGKSLKLVNNMSSILVLFQFFQCHMPGRYESTDLFPSGNAYAVFMCFKINRNKVCIFFPFNFTFGKINQCAS